MTTPTPFGTRASPADNEQQARIRRIHERGEAGRWRRLVRPERAMVDRLDALASRAPHLAELSTMVRRHHLAAIHMEMPVGLPPTLIVGGPGIGKTWYLDNLARVLGIPYRAHAMSAASHSDAISGGHGSWHNSQVGLVARTLLAEEVANPLIFIDEFDKTPPSAGVDDL